MLLQAPGLHSKITQRMISPTTTYLTMGIFAILRTVGYGFQVGTDTQRPPRVTMVTLLFGDLIIPRQSSPIWDDLVNGSIW